ncbi:uncharacterized protein LY79DRAFT_159162 [Colletotrichum navitas]|uniref:Uncharacterized protein n=1 Tax=Colletotrichum navitas TaxID=681940 RepID=A0AAD8PJI9_9PEZI|nr:uncharacterized protein LY79DRAFT_159162 [Colletotrichum navitas]KAK1564138.1 hypothetical protein LY79DRAFT_159162 [Colletotrichum navitas]
MLYPYPYAVPNSQGPGMMSCHFAKSLSSFLSSPPWPASAPLSRFCHCTTPYTALTHCVCLSFCLPVCLSVSLDAFGILRSPPPFFPHRPPPSLLSSLHSLLFLLATCNFALLCERNPRKRKLTYPLSLLPNILDQSRYLFVPKEEELLPLSTPNPSIHTLVFASALHLHEGRRNTTLFTRLTDVEPNRITPPNTTPPR